MSRVLRAVPLFSVLLGGLPLVLGRVFSAVRELWLAHQLGPTDSFAEYVVASTIFLAVGGLLSGVASALMIRDTGKPSSVAAVVLTASCIVVCAFFTYSVLPSANFASPLTVWCLVLMMPFFAVYGVGNGILIRQGRVVAGMVAAGVQPAVALAVMVLPWSDLALGAACGNLVGSILMASLTLHFMQARGVAVFPDFDKRIVFAGLAIAGVSLTNIASPIIDRFFAASLGNSNLVLLNLATIVYAAVTGTLGIALGNAAVGKSFTSNSSVDMKGPLVLGVFCAVAIAALAIPAGWYIGSRNDYEPGSSATMGQLLVIYAVAIPVALLNQVWIRVWNRHAGVQDMIKLAASLLVLNILGDLVLVKVLGVVGIAVATVLVQLVQCLYLGARWNQKRSAVSIVIVTIAVALIVKGIAIA